MIKTSAVLSFDDHEKVLIFGFKKTSIVLFLFKIKRSTFENNFNFSFIF